MNLSGFFVDKNETIINGIKKLDEMAKKIILITEDNKLVGVVTDGDVRRWILHNGNLNEPIERIMNNNPIYIYEHEQHKIETIFKEYQIQALPVLDKSDTVVDIIFINDEWKDVKGREHKKIDVPVVIMAGGKGTRLYPYTKVLPKPLIPIGEYTIIEHIMQKFESYGCNQFYLTVNYKKNMIKAYLEDNSMTSHISYVEEEKFLGTGGSLYLLKDTLDKTFFVSNCDILIDADYEDIIKYHKSQGYKITMVTSLKSYTIPYGVISVRSGGSVHSIVEKPEYNFQVNTGLYVLEPEVIKEIPENQFYHITELINEYVARGEAVGVYPITGNAWLDMGEIKEMENMISKLKS